MVVIILIVVLHIVSIHIFWTFHGCINCQSSIYMYYFEICCIIWNFFRNFGSLDGKNAKVKSLPIIR